MAVILGWRYGMLGGSVWKKRVASFYSDEADGRAVAAQSLSNSVGNAMLNN